MKIYILFVTCLLIYACKTDLNQNAAETSSATTALAFFGDTIDTQAGVSVTETLEALKTNDSLLTNVTGYVTSVCQVKGCWMVLSQNPDDSTGLFVKFKDYGFFVPLDFAGSKVTLAGKAFKEVTSVEDLKHYAEDEGKSAEEIAKITEPAEEMKFLARGVALIEKSK
jgi:hypothetical protein